MPRINPHKESKDLCTENCKTLTKEMKDNTNTIYHVLELEESTMWEGLYYPKQFRFGVISIKLPILFFTELWQKISHFTWKHKRLPITKAILRKKNRTGVINLLAFILNYKATEIKMVLAQNYKYSSTQQDKKFRDKLTQLWALYLWQRRQEYTMEKRQALQ